MHIKYKVSAFLKKTPLSFMGQKYSQGYGQWMMSIKFKDDIHQASLCWAKRYLPV